MPDPTHSVTINKGAVKELALYGPQDRAEALYKETYPVMKKLGMEPGRVFRPQKRFEGGRPCIHDIIPWLESLTEESAEEEKTFLRRLHATVRSRAHQDVIAKVEG